MKDQPSSISELGAIPLIRDFTVFLIRAITWDLQIITAILGSNTKSKDQEEAELSSEER